MLQKYEEIKFVLAIWKKFFLHILFYFFFCFRFFFLLFPTVFLDFSRSVCCHIKALTSFYTDAYLSLEETMETKCVNKIDSK